jgi:Spy/CpxP family protein refolding chaperone
VNGVFYMTMTQKSQVTTAMGALLLTASMASVLFMAAPVANAYEEHRHYASPEKLAKKYNLTAEQQAQLKAFHEKNRDEMRQRYEVLRTKKEALTTYIGSKDAELTQALTLQDDIAKEMKALGELRLQRWFELKAIAPAAMMEDMHKQHHRHSHALMAPPEARLGSRSGARFGSRFAGKKPPVF